MFEIHAKLHVVLNVKYPIHFLPGLQLMGKL
jgi:hypothetical protein